MFQLQLVKSPADEIQDSLEGTTKLARTFFFCSYNSGIGFAPLYFERFCGLPYFRDWEVDIRWVDTFLLNVRSLCPEVGRYHRHVKGADVDEVTTRMVDVAVVSLHTADDAVSLQMEGNEVTKRIWS